MTTLGSDRTADPRHTTTTSVATSVALVASLALAWAWTVGQVHMMSSTTQGLAQAGRAMTFDMGTGAFVGMWAVMMGAMMVPTVGPLVVDYARSRAPLAAASARAVFTAGYLLVWAATGIAALLVLRALNGAHASASLDRAGGALLLVAGAYQFSGSKHSALRRCRAALRSPTTLSGGHGLVAEAQDGLHQGLCCLACCGPLMAVLLAVGVMNLAWMAALSGVCFAETNWRHRAAVTSVTGVALLGLGAVVLAHPQFLNALAPNPMAMGPVMH